MRDHATTEKDRGYARSGFPLVMTSHALNHSYDSLMPVLYPSMILEFNLTYGSVGLLVMGFRLSSGALQLLMGFLGRFVPRKMLLGLGMIWQSVLNSLIAASQEFGHVFTLRTLAGIGASPQHPTGAAYITEVFPRQRLGRVLGINIVAGQLGSFITPILASLLLSYLGWKETILAFSIPGTVVGIAFLFIKESGRSMVGIRQAGALLLRDMRQVLKDKTVLAIIAVEMVMAIRMGAADFLPSYFTRDLGMTPFEAGLLFSIFLGSGIPAPYFWGRLSDRFERRKIVMLALGMACAFWYLLTYGGTSLQLLAILIPLGFATVGIGGVVQAFVGEKTNKENRDLVYGIYFTLAFTFSSVSPVIIGYLADSLGFPFSFYYVALVSLLAVIAAGFLK